MISPVFVPNNLLLATSTLANYSSLDWDRLSSPWELTMYTTCPESDEPADKPSNSYTFSSQLYPRSWDEVMEEVLQDRAEAWEQLADL